MNHTWSIADCYLEDNILSLWYVVWFYFLQIVQSRLECYKINLFEMSFIIIFPMGGRLHMRNMGGISSYEYVLIGWAQGCRMKSIVVASFHMRVDGFSIWCMLHVPSILDGASNERGEYGLRRTRSLPTRQKWRKMFGLNDGFYQ